MHGIVRSCAPVMLLLTLAGGCGGGGNPADPSDDQVGVVTGQTVALLTGTLGPGGGVIVVDQPGDVLDGLAITVPPDAFSEPREFTISRTEIRSHRLGEHFHPITPLVTIDCGGGYATVPVEVRIPVAPAADSFAMGFLFDPATGELEGIPSVARDDTSITVTARTFSAIPAAGKRARTADSGSALRLVVSSIAESVLASRAVITTGFTPGRDDWEFPNFGSYVSPGGHCVGQSLTAMWYFYAKRRTGAPPLFHAFDTVNDPTRPGVLWQDNPSGYRFASVIQRDMGGLTRSGRWSVPSMVTFHEFAYSMLVAAQPQLIFISNAQAGHAMVIYKLEYVDHSNGTLYVADPNYPNNRAPDGTASIRTIPYRNRVLGPYNTGVNAAANAVVMDSFMYAGYRALIEWYAIGRYWADVENGTIGNSVFPICELRMGNDGDKVMAGETVTDRDTIEVYSWSSEAVGINNTRRMGLQVYDTLGVKIPQRSADELAGVAVMPLRKGLNRFGFWSLGRVSNGWEYVDFRWRDVRKYTLTVEPASVVSPMNTELTFTANAFGTAPTPFRLVWDFGDRSPEQTVNNGTQVTHRYTAAGFYTVTVRMYEVIGDRQDTWQVAQAQATVTIPGYHGCQIWCEVHGRYTTITANSAGSMDTSRTDGNWWPNWERVRGELSRDTFVAAWDTVDWDGRPYSGRTTVVFSPDSSAVRTFSVAATVGRSFGATDYIRVSGTDVPFKMWYGDTRAYEVRGVAACTHIQALTDTTRSQSGTRTLDGYDCRDDSYVQVLLYNGN